MFLTHCSYTPAWLFFFFFFFHRMTSFSTWKIMPLLSLWISWPVWLWPSSLRMVHHETGRQMLLTHMKWLMFSFVLQPYCGLPITTYFSAVKLRWLLDNSETVQKAVKEGRCLFGTVDSWIMWVCGFIQVCFRKWFWWTFYGLHQMVSAKRAFDCCLIWSYHMIYDIYDVKSTS